MRWNALKPDFWKRRNRTLLEMHIGMLVFGVVCEIPGLFLKWRVIYAVSLWLGVALAMLAAAHMQRSLERSLDQGEAAVKLVFKDYTLRYVLFVVIMLMIIITKKLNPLVVFLGYMGLKVSALAQPFTHRFTNWIFHETDPVPQALREEDQEPDPH